MSVEIVFETHATTTDNEADIATGWVPGKLSSTGRIQARELGVRRWDDGISAIFTSDLHRAVETTVLAFTGSPLPIQLDGRLRGCNYGDLNGSSREALRAVQGQHLDEPFPGGQSYRDVVRGMASFLDDLASAHDGERVLLIGHSATRFALDHLLTDIPLEDVVTSPYIWQPGWLYLLPDGWHTPNSDDSPDFRRFPMRMTRSLPVLILAAVALTAGCGGGSSPTTATLISPGVPLSATSTSSAGSTPASASGLPSQDSDATVGFLFSSGDHVEASYVIDHTPVSLASAGAVAQSCVAQLTNDPARALVWHLVVTAKLTSSMSGTFTLNFGQQAFPMAAKYADGEQRCWSVGEPGYVSLTLTPGSSVRIELWLLGDGFRTPQFPDGDPKILRGLAFSPSMHVGTSVVAADAVIDDIHGTQVLACNLEVASHVQAEIFADPAAFAKGDTDCAPAVTRADFAAMEAKAGTVGATSP
ncbi:broad specificity phosphatase PhoE [Catenulispora sp. GAS73]|uniref:histidine phosphatase family protein n=1 Tax=Catenulispora sp. GAS73 TaxID=3156269 RepID=UPI0035198649